ncbi:ABC transporter ATP-binding protein [Hydrocarboniphaga sp.]|uniref:ABC transporter ATP-binding protein n=1 Tax=Hydrocarboniphaga sp. TaxID=2033016 RepID=UPI003D0DDA44
MSPAPEPTRAPVLTVRDVCKRYGDKHAVHAIRFDVAPGEIVGLLGPNGAGKTTTINMVLGVLEPSAGQILIDGHDVSRARKTALASTNFAAVYAPLPGNLTVEQNLRIFGLIYQVQPLQPRIDALLQQFDLLNFRDTRCGLLSSGEQTRVCLAKALLNRPKLLLLDEPTASLDPSTARDIREQIRRIAKDDGGGILWTSHNMVEVEEVCDRVLIMSHGRVLLEGDPRRLPAAHNADSLEDLFVRLARDPANGAEASR